MTGALVLALPGLLCAVMAWDLSRPSTHRGYSALAAPVDLRQLAVPGCWPPAPTPSWRSQCYCRSAHTRRPPCRLG